MKRIEMAVLGAGLLAAGSLWAMGADGPPPGTTSPSAAIVDVQEDSMRVGVRWSAAPGATFYVVEVGEDGGDWIRQVETTALEASLWALVGPEEQLAYACVTAYNRSPIRGRQEGGRACIAWTVPADVAPPGDPGGVEVEPDTAMVTDSTLASVQVHGGPYDLRALGDHEVPMSVTGTLADGTTVACAQVPGGGVGWVRAEIRDGWHVYAVPHDVWWPEPDCRMRTELGGDSGDAISFPDPPTHQYTLSVWPADLPVLLWDQTVTLTAHRVTQ